MSLRPIGVFDSGVGGLTVVKALRLALPEEDIVYLGDTARVPYGSKSPETVVRYALACGQRLLAEGVKLILVACNTASAHALGALEAHAGCPVIGAVRPGAASAARASGNGRIGVIGTRGTILSGAYPRALAELGSGGRVAAVPAPLLVPLAEEGWVDHDVTRQVARHYLQELARIDPALDTLILGCTHYPLLLPVIQEAARAVFGHPVTVVDSATAMAAAAQSALIERNELCPEKDGNGAIRFMVTDASRLDELAPRFLGEPLASYEVVDL